VAFLGVLEQNPSYGLASVVKDSNLAIWEERSLRSHLEFIVGRKIH
jgi:hypothetical protein